MSTDWVKHRSSIKLKLERIIAIANGHSTTAITLNEVNYYLEVVTAEQKRLTQAHDNLIQVCTDDAAISAQDTATEAVEKKLVEARCKLLVIQSSLFTTGRNSGGNNTGGSPGASADVKLPKMDLPTFSGNYLDWSSFHDLFTSIVHNNTKISDSQKLHYLKNSLRGEAAGLIQSIDITDANFLIAWNLLKQRYQDKRQIVYSHLDILFGQRPMNSTTPSELRKLLDTTTKHVRALNSQGLPTDQWDAVLVYLVIKRLDHQSREQWELQNPGTTLPTFSSLETFLEQRCKALEASTATVRKSTNTFSQQQYIPIKKAKVGSSYHATADQSYSSAPVCAVCKANHWIFHCPKFLGSSSEERTNMVREFKLCFNCLHGNHSSSKCLSKHTCKRCNGKHNTLLHFERKRGNESESKQKSNTENRPTSDTKSHSSVSSHLCGQTGAQHQGFLNTAIVKFVDEFGQEHKCRALLDNGSQTSFITESCVQRLGLKRHNSNQTILGIGQSNSGNALGSVNVKFQALKSNFSFQLSALIMKRITGLLPSKQIMNINWDNLVNMPLADPNFHKPAEVDILLDVSVYNHLLVDGRFPVNGFLAQNTKLGWILSSTLSSQSQDDDTIYAHLSTIAIQDQLKQFWELEEINNNQSFFSKEEQQCEQHFIANHKRDDNGRYIASLPRKDNNLQLGLSREIAIKRLEHTERRLDRFPNHRQTYHDFMDEYLALGHMELVPENEVREVPGQTNYLPHHFVQKESSTTALRVVFDGSAATSNGISLNETLMVGPKVQDDIFNILLRFRLHKFAFTADISKMYRQIKVQKPDSDLQRIVWRKSKSDQIQDYRLTTVTYGTASGPFLATRALKQCAIDYEKQFPTASAVVQQDFYVDDVMSGADTIDEALELQQNLIKMLAMGGFDLRKWTSNNHELLESVPADYRETKLPLQIESDDSIKALGLNWNPSADYFFFKVNLDSDVGEVTKRRIISDVAKLFDPLGWLAPVIIIGKTLYQKLWIKGLDWDDSIPREIEKQWTEFRDQLFKLQQLRIPRFHGINATSQIHGFSDASEKAYAAAVYIRVETNTGVQTFLICSKTKVAPVKTISIPRLELCGAVLLTRLIKVVTRALNVSFEFVHTWTDSTIVLAWLSSQPNRWKTFVANRVSEIMETLPRNFWNHVSSEHNPADLASRGVLPEQLNNNQLWWIGPAWLKLAKDDWPHQTSTNSTTVEEERAVTSHVTQVEEEPELLKSYSSLIKLQRHTAWWLRFHAHLKNGKTTTQCGFLTSSELNQALHRWIKIIQVCSFSETINQLKNGLTVNSNLASLNPFIDSNGILRVGGRIRNAKISYDKKHPILLPKSSHLTKSIIDHEHEVQLHAGPQLLLASLFEKYWIINARKLVRSRISKCIFCFKERAKVLQQQMGDLPFYRVEPARPFLRTGVDYAGPCNVKTIKGRGGKIIKSWIALFVCCSTKAVHLELVSELTTDCFLAALSRFVSRRGICKDIYSDNATNFVGANNELQDLRRLFNSSEHNQKISRQLSKTQTNWHFIPAKAPHFGGLWEAGIKSTKLHLRRVLGTTTPTFEEFTTILTRIEACLNSRPLTPLSTDPNDLSVLTPGSFLIGSALTSIPEPDLTELNINRLSRFQVIQQASQHFWKRWHQEYLHQLQQRNKWQSRCENIKIGDMVLIKEDNSPPLKWHMARVVELFPGQDGIVRVVNVRTQSGIVKRPIAKLCLLPIEN